jgi:purine-binding chemotaxis protein CheW
MPDPRALVFRLGGRVLAAPGGAGGRVVEVDACTRVPTAPPYLIGLGNAGGTVLSLADVRPALGLPAAPWAWPLLAQVVGGEALRVAFAIEEVLGFEPYRPDRLEPLGDGNPAGLAAFALGELALTPGRAVLLDLPRIVEALALKRPERRDRPPVRGST